MERPRPQPDQPQPRRDAGDSFRGLTERQPDQTSQDGGGKSPELDLPRQAKEGALAQGDSESTLVQLAEQDPTKFAMRVIKGILVLDDMIDRKNRRNNRVAQEMRDEWGPIATLDSMQRYTAFREFKHQGYAEGLQDALKLIEEHILRSEWPEDKSERDSKK